MTSQTLNSPLQRVILRPQFKANVRTIKSTPRPWNVRTKKTKAPARKSRPTRQLVMLASNSRNNRDRKRDPRVSFFVCRLLPCFGLAGLAALGKVGPLWRNGSSQPRAVFRLGGLWWPKCWHKIEERGPGPLLSALFWLGRGGRSRQSRPL